MPSSDADGPAVAPSRRTPSPRLCAIERSAPVASKAPSLMTTPAPQPLPSTAPAARLEGAIVDNDARAESAHLDGPGQRQLGGRRAGDDDHAAGGVGRGG